MPAISGTDNGTASYIEEGINGYVFEDCSLEDLKKKLELVVCDRENIPRMGKAGYEHVLAHFQFANLCSSRRCSLIYSSKLRKCSLWKSLDTSPAIVRCSGYRSSNPSTALIIIK